MNKFGETNASDYLNIVINDSNRPSLFELDGNKYN